MKRREPNWKRAYGSDPDEYKVLFERTLANLKEGQIVHKKTTLRAILVAALISLLLVGTALAIGNALGILNFFERDYGVTPRNNAAESIAKNLGAADDGRVRLTVREAIYDGETVRALLAVEPLDAQKTVVAYQISDILEIEAGKTEEACAEAYTRTTGRAIVRVLDAWVDVDNALDYSYSASFVRDGDAVLTYCEVNLNGETPETAQIVANAETADDTACTVPFTLQKAPVSVRALTPGNAQGSGVTVLSATLSQTPFADYLRVVYQAQKHAYEEIARVFAENATYYMTGGGVYAHTDPECSGMRNAGAATYREVIAAEKLPCPVCAGGDMTLMAGGEAWTIELLDESGQAVAANSSGSESIRTEAGDAHSQLIVIQSGTLPAGDLYVRFTAPDGAVYPPVKLA